MSIKEKIGMYSTDEILEFMTEGEGRGFLGRSMFDAMYFEIERLTELCNKYEEEHKTTFETWQKDIKENEQLHSIIKEAREYIEHENFKRTILVGVSTKKYTKDILNKVLEILDKVEE